MNKETYKQLDKFYTKKSVAKKCLELLLNTFNFKNKTKTTKKIAFIENLFFIEPSAGSGVFLNEISIKNFNSIGIDILPTNNNIHKLDFLKDNKEIKELIEKHKISKNEKPIVIGNPPFGKKSNLAIAFINEAFKYSNIVGFIVPIQFRKYIVQNRINNKAHLILDYTLEENSFETFSDNQNKDYSLRCCFQIWSIDKDLNQTKQNLRIIEKPSTYCEDFEAYQYNRTEQTKKYFDYEWDFAVLRQGYGNYNEKIFKKEDLNPKKQWIFIKANSKKALKKLLKINYEELSKKNTSIPGFGKADLVEAYLKS
jgi:hypothetical protein